MVDHVKPDAVHRKLAALLSADIAGYSRLTAHDEVATLKTLNSHRDAMGALIRQHGGRVVDAVGDNLLAEFPSVVDAVACSVAIQRELQARNADLPHHRKMQFRIGLHLGDVMIDGERIAGDGINIAARLEALAEPGGICISGTVHEQVRNKLSETYHDLGEQTLKNITHPVRVYRVRLTDDEGREEAAALTVPGFAGRPAIAVLAFDNLSGDPEQEFFADGIAEDLITRLSAFRLFPVIARNSSFVYKGRSVDVKQVSQELGVRYVVEGSVRKAAQRVRISAQLIDAITGYHVWAQRYDRELTDIFKVQDEITEAMFAAMHPELQRFESESAARREPRSPDAWEYAQRAWWHFNKLTKDSNPKARLFAEKAIDLDPHFVWALWVLVNVAYCDVFFGWSDSPAERIAEALRTAKRGVAADDKDPFAQMSLGLVYSLTGQRDEMLGALELAVHLNPSIPLAYHLLGSVRAITGRPDDGIALLHKAIRLSPRDPWMYDFFQSMAWAHFAAERYVDAVEWSRKSMQLRPSFSLVALAASLARLDRIDEARIALEASPKKQLSNILSVLSTANPDFVERALDGLRKAGWKE